MGATRGGISLAKEPVGKTPERYKLVEPGTIFYNPMRILIGSIAMLDEGGGSGITSPDYVVFRTRPDALHPRWFYYWLRSHEGAAFIQTLARGAVRERMMFRRLASAEILAPNIEAQRQFAAAMVEVERARAAAEAQLKAAASLSHAHLLAAFQRESSREWPTRMLGEVGRLLPSRSIVADGDTSVLAITTACLTESGFDPKGVKRARMWATDAAECAVVPGEILVARSNTTELVGRAAVFTGTPVGAVASDLTIRIQMGSDVAPEFAGAYLSYLFATGYWRERAGGASGSMKKITRGQLETQPVPVPAKRVQDEFVRVLETKMTSAKRARLAAEGELAALKALPGALLLRAFIVDV